MNWFTDVLTKKYAQFDGRARRQEFWMFTLISFLISFGLAIVDSVAGLTKMAGGSISPLQTLYALGVLVPSVAVAIRRLHDIGKPGWWILIGLVPCIGAIVLIVFYAQDSQPGSNEYGPNPKGDSDRYSE